MKIKKTRLLNIIKEELQKIKEHPMPLQGFVPREPPRDPEKAYGWDASDFEKKFKDMNPAEQDSLLRRLIDLKRGEELFEEGLLDFLKSHKKRKEGKKAAAELRSTYEDPDSA